MKDSCTSQGIDCDHVHTSQTSSILCGIKMKSFHILWCTMLKCLLMLKKVSNATLDLGV